MLALILLILFSLGMAFLATQNTGTVDIRMGSYLLPRIPVYMIVFGSMLLGIFVSWLLSLLGTISSSLTIHGKDAALKKANDAIERLKEDKHALELEIARLNGEQEEQHVVEDVRDETVEPTPSLSHRLKHSFGF